MYFICMSICNVLCTKFKHNKQHQHHNLLNRYTKQLKIVEIDVRNAAFTALVRKTDISKTPKPIIFIDFVFFSYELTMWQLNQGYEVLVLYYNYALSNGQIKTKRVTRSV